MASRRRTCSRAPSSSRARFPTCRRECTLPLSIRASAATVSRLPSAGATDGSTSGPTTDSCSSRRTGSEASRRQSSSRKPLPPRACCPRPSTGATSSLPRLRTSPAASSSSALGPKVAVGELVRLEAALARHRDAPDPGDRSGRRSLRERPAQPQARGPRQVGIDDGSRVEVEVGFERYYAVAARTSPRCGAATSSSTRTPTGTSPWPSTG